MNSYSKRNDVIQGVRAAVPVALGYIPAAIAYGLLAKNAGVPLAATLGMSALVYAGASQFAAVSMLAAGQSVVSMVFLTFILNLRHFLMSTTIASRLPESSRAKRAAVAFGITDETFSVASFGDRQLSTGYLLGLNITAYLSWVGAGVMGFVAGGILSASLQSGMGIALYAMFIGLLIPGVRTSRVGLSIVGAAMVLNALAQSFLPQGLGIVVVALGVAGVATWIVPAGEDSDQVDGRGTRD